MDKIAIVPSITMVNGFVKMSIEYWREGSEMPVILMTPEQAECLEMRINAVLQDERANIKERLDADSRARECVTRRETNRNLAQRRIAVQNARKKAGDIAAAEEELLQDELDKERENPMRPDGKNYRDDAIEAKGLDDE